MNPLKALPQADQYIRDWISEENAQQEHVTVAEVGRYPIATAEHIVGADIYWEVYANTIYVHRTAFMFDAHTQQRITLSDLLTLKGQQAFRHALPAKHSQAIYTFLKTAPRGKEYAAQENYYQQCSGRTWQSLPDDLLIYPNHLATRIGDCMPRVDRALDDLQGSELVFTFTELKPWLSPYGRCRLLQQKATCP